MATIRPDVLARVSKPRISAELAAHLSAGILLVPVAVPLMPPGGGTTFTPSLPGPRRMASSEA